MQELIACVDHIRFDLELAVEQQLGAQPLPFPGMDSKLIIGALINICFKRSITAVFLIYDFHHIRWIARGQKTFNNDTCSYYFSESGAAVCDFFMRAACMKGMCYQNLFKDFMCKSGVLLWADCTAFSVDRWNVSFQTHQWGKVCGVQALAQRFMQERRPMWIFTWVWYDKDAWVLFLL